MDYHEIVDKVNRHTKGLKKSNQKIETHQEPASKGYIKQGNGSILYISQGEYSNIYTYQGSDSQINNSHIKRAWKEVQGRDKYKRSILQGDNSEMYLSQGIGSYLYVLQGACSRISYHQGKNSNLVYHNEDYIFQTTFGDSLDIISPIPSEEPDEEPLNKLKRDTVIYNLSNEEQQAWHDKLSRASCIYKKGDNED